MDDPYAQKGLTGLRGVTSQTGIPGQISTGVMNTNAVGGGGLSTLRYQQGGPVEALQTGARLADIAAAPLSPPGHTNLVRIYKEAELAVQGQHPAPERALRTFVDTFGERQLEELVAGMQVKDDKPRLIDGPGGERDDMVPANIDGVREARLSDGEFVLTADAVRGAGDGDPKLGAERLMQMNEMLSGRGEAARLNVEKVS